MILAQCQQNIRFVQNFQVKSRWFKSTPTLNDGTGMTGVTAGWGCDSLGSAQAIQVLKGVSKNPEFPHLRLKGSLSRKG